jgi:hypothetical protein
MIHRKKAVFMTAHNQLIKKSSFCDCPELFMPIPVPAHRSMIATGFKTAGVLRPVVRAG